MASAYQYDAHKPREWRRRVSIRARVRADCNWSECQILNISSRGMLLQYSRPLSIGSEIEIRQAGKTIPVTVIWREGFRAGLASAEPIQVSDWLAESGAKAAGPAFAGLPTSNRNRDRKRDEDDWKQLSRKLEFLAVAGFAAALAMGAAGLAATTLLEPLTTAANILG